MRGKRERERAERERERVSVCVEEDRLMGRFRNRLTDCKILINGRRGAKMRERVRERERLKEENRKQMEEIASHSYRGGPINRQI